MLSISPARAGSHSLERWLAGPELRSYWRRLPPLSDRREFVLKRILLTGMSGTGKSTVIGELAARGYKARDADSDEFSQWVEVSGGSDPFGSQVEGNRDWVWREDRIQDLLSTEDTRVLFLGGYAVNMGKFLPQFDHVVLLSAPAKVLVERLRAEQDDVVELRQE